MAAQLLHIRTGVCACTIQKTASIQTERLTLKPYSGQDVEPLVNLITNREIAKTFMVPDFETAEHTVALANKLISFSQVNDTQHPEYGIYPGGKLIGSINDCGIEENDLEIGYVLQANCVPSVVSKGKP